MHKLLLALTLAAVLLCAQDVSIGAGSQQDINKILEEIEKIKNNITKINQNITKIGINTTKILNKIEHINTTITDLKTVINDLRDRIQNNFTKFNSSVSDIRLWVFVAVALAAVSAMASIAALVASLRRRQLPQDVCA